MTDANEDLLDHAAAAALALASERPWRDVTFRDVADRAGVQLADLYRLAPGKTRVIDWLARRFDLAALKLAAGDGQDPHDRLFEAAMRRLEVMEPHRAALCAIQRDEGAAPMIGRAPSTARAILEGAGVDTSGGKGVARVVAMAAVWGRVLQVWRDDEGALNRTMAELDRRLKQMRENLTALRAGY